MGFGKKYLAKAFSQASAGLEKNPQRDWKSKLFYEKLNHSSAGLDS